MADFRQRNGVPRPMDEERAVGIQDTGSRPGSRAGSRPSTPTPEQRGLLNEKRNGHHRHLTSEVYTHHIYPTGSGLQRFRDRFMRKGKKKIGVVESLQNIFFCTCALLYPYYDIALSDLEKRAQYFTSLDTCCVGCAFPQYQSRA